MITARIEYIGDLRTKCTHVKSGVEIITDAPVDNNGKGASFSPTDLVANAYVSCMITIIGIYCNTHGINFKRAIGTVTKTMASSPRRISKLEINLDLAGNEWSDLEFEKVQRAAKACPVAKSVHEDMEIVIDITN